MRCGTEMTDLWECVSQYKAIFCSRRGKAEESMIEAMSVEGLPPRRVLQMFIVSLYSCGPLIFAFSLSLSEETTMQSDLYCLADRQGPGVESLNQGLIRECSAAGARIFHSSQSFGVGLTLFTCRVMMTTMTTTTITTMTTKQASKDVFFLGKRCEK